MLARAGKAKRRPWSPAEDEKLSRIYGSGCAALRRAFPGRTLSGIYQRAFKLGINVTPRWTPLEEKRLFWLWEEGLRLSAIANRLRPRSRRSVYSKAKELGLEVGCPAGYEYVSAAAERTGYCLATLLRILDFGGVRLRIALSDPARPKRHYRQHFVDPEAVDEAIGRWHATEAVEPAATRRGLVGWTLRRWLREAGIVMPQDRPKQQRVLTEVIDRVIAERRGKAA